jgi:CelD/BcsL family acetyltransferase involved in cellulose biosynthesis
MSRTAIIDATSLDPSLRAAWRNLRAGNPALASPYFAPEFTEAVASVTRSARLLVAEDNGRVAAILPLQHRAVGLYGPIGGPLNDLHGLIAGNGAALDPANLLEAAGIPMMALVHSPVGPASLGARFGNTHAFHVLSLTGGYQAYEARREPFAKSAFRAIRTRTEKARKHYGTITHKFDDRSSATLEKLIAWKRDQYRETHQTSIFDIPWVRELTDRLHTSRDPELRGQLSSLYFGDELVAAHFGLRTRDTLHYWFPGYEPKAAELSPGNILLRMMAEDAAAAECQALHLGAGDYRYKHEFADVNFPVTDGIAFARSFMGRTAAAAGLALARMDRTLPEQLAGLPGRAIRRIDRHLAFRAA